MNNFIVGSILISCLLVGTKSYFVFPFDDYDYDYDYEDLYAVSPLRNDCNSKVCTVDHCPPGYALQPADGFKENCATCIPYGPRLDCSTVTCKSASCKCGTYLQPADGINTCCSVCVSLRDIGQFCDYFNPCYSNLVCSSDNYCNVPCPAPSYPPVHPRYY